MMKKLFFPLFVFLFLVLAFLVIRPRWYLNLTKSVNVSTETGAALVEKYGCRSCHRINGIGALNAPELNSPMDASQTSAWLQNPRKIKRNTAMPNFYLSDSEIESILLYLNKMDSK